MQTAYQNVLFILSRVPVTFVTGPEPRLQGLLFLSRRILWTRKLWQERRRQKSARLRLLEMFKRVSKVEGNSGLWFLPVIPPPARSFPQEHNIFVCNNLCVPLQALIGWCRTQYNLSLSMPVCREYLPIYWYHCTALCVSRDLAFVFADCW